MTGAVLAAYVRKKTRTNSTTLSDADIVTFANPVKEEMVTEVLKINEDYFGIFQVRNLEAAKRNYALPTDLLNSFKYIEAKLDGTNWVKLTEVEIQKLGIATDEDSIRSYFSMRKPSFEIFGNELIIYCGDAMIAVTDGLRLWSMIYPADFTTAQLADATTDLSVNPTATSFGFPRAMHKLMSERIVIEWKESQDKPIALTQYEQLWGQRFGLVLDSLRYMNLDRPLEASTPTDTGHNY